MDELKEQPVIDWELGLKLASNKMELAEEMLNMLITNLADEVMLIKQYYANKNDKEFRQRLHRLHGALCYCGAPRLKKSIVLLENAVKQNKLDMISTLLKQFENESNLLIKTVLASKCVN